jgi:hypothetical protein
LPIAAGVGDDGAGEEDFHLGMFFKIVDGLERAGLVLLVAVQVGGDVAGGAPVAAVHGVMHAGVFFDECLDARIMGNQSCVPSSEQKSWTMCSNSTPCWSATEAMQSLSHAELRKLGVMIKNFKREDADRPFKQVAIKVVIPSGLIRMRAIRIWKAHNRCL